MCACYLLINQHFYICGIYIFSLHRSSSDDLKTCSLNNKMMMMDALYVQVLHFIAVFALMIWPIYIYISMYHIIYIIYIHKHIDDAQSMYCDSHSVVLILIIIILKTGMVNTYKLHDDWAARQILIKIADKMRSRRAHWGFCMWKAIADADEQRNSHHWATTFVF